jgi:SAM-dependent methyltransferase
MAGLLRPIRRVVRAAHRTWLRLVERLLGVDTGGIVELDELGVDERDREGYEGYEGSGWLDLRRMLRPGEVKPTDVFVDLGSGKGKVVMLAARYPFARVIGVELSEQLSEIARRNLANGRGRRRAKQVELITADALQYEIPTDSTVIYMYNPFRGEVFEAVVARLIESVDRHPRQVRLIYLNPKEHDHLMATGRFRQVRSAGRIRLHRDEAARSYIRMYVLDPA